jgi:hypothetical protein
MERISKAEQVYLMFHDRYSNSLANIISFIKNNDDRKIRLSYLYSDSVLTIQLLERLETISVTANEMIQRCLADTLISAMMDIITNDSRLADAVLNCYENVPFFSDSLKKLKSEDSSSISVLHGLRKKFSALKLVTPLQEANSSKYLIRQIEQEIPVSYLVHSLYANKQWAERIDSAIFATLDVIQTCPTTRSKYKLIINDSTYKRLNIYCPIDSDMIENSQADFLKYYFGHWRLENHGAIIENEKNWVQ